MRHDGIPDDGDICIIWNSPDQAEQCEMRDGNAYLWRHGITDDLFCHGVEILKWRGCGGFDF